MPDLPDGDAVGPEGPLAGVDLTAEPAAPFSLYVHVPFCTVRCGYCDFNTYTASELGGGASRASYAETAISEIRLAAEHLRAAGREPERVETVFFGGGTPTILPASDLAAMLDAARQAWGFAPDIEVTTEANPDTVDEAYAAELARAGFTRMSIGMQSAQTHVLATLDRTHSPENVARAVAAAKSAGLQVSLDLIYGTPGESLEDWRSSVETALALEPDHVSAYALGIESGTKMGAQLKRGEIVATDPNVLADMYELVDDALGAAGYGWYEISNWARGAEYRCRHNIAYWRNADWWGIGPGAHSHAGPVRWWNAKHPRPHAARVAAGALPVAGREVLDADSREFERIMLGVRLIEGLQPPWPTDRRLSEDQSRRLSEGREAGVETRVSSAKPAFVISAPRTSTHYRSLSTGSFARPAMTSGSCDDAPDGERTANWMSAVAQLVRDGLAEEGPAVSGVVLLTRDGRLQADAVTRLLTDL